MCETVKEQASASRDDKQMQMHVAVTISNLTTLAEVGAMPPRILTVDGNLHISVSDGKDLFLNNESFTGLFKEADNSASKLDPLQSQRLSNESVHLNVTTLVCLACPFLLVRLLCRLLKQ